MIDKTKQRIQLDLGSEQVALMDALTQQLSLRSRADLLQQAFALFLWAVDETLAGHRVISVDREQLKTIARYTEVNLPALQPLTFQNYQYLTSRQHPWKKQLFLKGRNMTVGQLMSTMQANNLDDEEAAEDLDLPVEQIREARAYYHTHQTLVDLETQEEITRLAGKEHLQRDPTKPVSG